MPGYVSSDNATGAIYMGLRDRKTLVNTIAGSYNLTEKMSTDLRLRHYWSLATYNDFFELTNDGHLAPSDYISDDLNYNALNVDFTYRWNFTKGSEIAVNWKYAIMHDGTQILNNYWSNVAELSQFPVYNSFSVKLLYYIDYEMIKSVF
jgi:hypothetical protein